jgi:methyl-accepting chemotaxis protein
MSATNSNSFLARLSIIKRLWLAFGLLVVLLVAGFGYGGYSLLSGQKDTRTSGFQRSWKTSFHEGALEPE